MHHGKSSLSVLILLNHLVGLIAAVLSLSKETLSHVLHIVVVLLFGRSISRIHSHEFKSSTKHVI